MIKLTKKDLGEKITHIIPVSSTYNFTWFLVPQKPDLKNIYFLRRQGGNITTQN